MKTRLIKNSISFSILILALTASSATPDSQESPRLLLGGPATIQNFPWLCTVVCCGPNPTRAVSSASLLTTKHVVTSTENLLQKITQPVNDAEKRAGQYYKMNTELRVICGSTLLMPNDPPANLKEFVSQKQVRKAERLFYPIHSSKIKPLSPDFPMGPWWDFEESVIINPGNYSSFFRSRLGNNFPLLFIEVDREFTEGEAVRRIPVPANIQDAKTWEAEELFLNTTQKLIDQKEDEIEAKWEDSCLVAGWGISTYDAHQTRSRIVYQRVSYVQEDACSDAYCSAYAEACDKFPYPVNRGAFWHSTFFCAKSMHYGDVCEMDRGAAAYCPTHLDGSVLGVLAIVGEGCGLNGLPGVYVRIDDIIRWRNVLYPPYYPRSPPPEYPDEDHPHTN